MAQAPNYTPSEDFSQDELNNTGGRSAILTEALDDELATIAQAHNALNANVQLNQRDDGEIRDQRVKLFTLDPAVLKLVSSFGGTVRGAWLTATAYAIKDVVTQSGNTYVAAVAHTSGIFATDLAAVRWVLVQLGAATAASGVPFSPTATLAATNVQAAIDEADTENRSLTAVVSATISSYITSVASSIGSSLVGFIQAGVGAVLRTLQHKNREFVSILDFGGDPTGVALCNSALDAAKIVSKTVRFPRNPVDGSNGIYRIENYNLQDLRLIGDRAVGANEGQDEQSVIEGSGNIFANCNNFSVDRLVVRNSAAGARGILFDIAAIDTRVGPITNCRLAKSTHHIRGALDATKTIVDYQAQNNVFKDASICSRLFDMAIFQGLELGNYTQANKRGLTLRSTSAMKVSGAFELQSEGAVYVINTVSATDSIRSLKFENAHFEKNGQVTPTADVTVNVTLSLARLEFDTCGFYLPTVAKPVELSSNTSLRIIHHNCTDIDFNNVAAGTVIASATPKRAGQTDAFYGQGGNIGTDGQIYASAGFRAQSAITVTITGAATPTPVAMPAAGAARLVLVTDATTAGSALLLLTGATAINVISSSLATITFTAVAGVLNGNTTGGAANRVLFFNFMAT